MQGPSPHSSSLAVGVVWLTLACVFPCASAAAASPATAEIIDAMIEAHGGMDRWVAAPTVSFVDEFRAGDATSGQSSRVVVEQGLRRAYIYFPGTEMRMAWDGERAWSENWAAPYPPRFLALLNYYFLNLPWLAKDPGVVLGDPGSGKIFDDPVEYVTIRMTFEPGVGDTPDDYYVLYIHPETHRLRACEYIVTYRSLLPEGTDSTEPHLLVFDEHATVGGLVVPTHYTIYEMDRSVYGSCAVTDWAFDLPFDASRMEMPLGAVLDESNP